MGMLAVKISEKLADVQITASARIKTAREGCRKPSLLKVLLKNNF
jgi:hypothetical protein